VVVQLVVQVAVDAARPQSLMRMTETVAPMVAGDKDRAEACTRQGGGGCGGPWRSPCGLQGDRGCLPLA